MFEWLRKGIEERIWRRTKKPNGQEQPWNIQKKQMNNVFHLQMATQKKKKNLQ